MPSKLFIFILVAHIFTFTNNIFFFSATRKVPLETRGRPSLDDQEGLHVVLKDHVVGELSLGESKAGLEVLLEKEGLLVGLDSSKHLQQTDI